MLKNLKGAVLTQAVDESLESVNLFQGGVADKQSGKYSGGMKRRLSVAFSLIGDPKQGRSYMCFSGFIRTPFDGKLYYFYMVVYIIYSYIVEVEPLRLVRIFTSEPPQLKSWLRH
ncbi:hypothetical protein P3S67_006275 [Capsicum chacoense]